MIGAGRKSKIPCTAKLYQPLSEECMLYSANGKVFVQGKRCTVYPFRQSRIYSILDDLALSRCNGFEPSLTVADSAVRNIVYGEVVQVRAEDGRTVWKRNSTPWLDALPAGAAAYESPLAYCFTNPVCVNDHHCWCRGAEQTVAPHATAAAWYAYPLAALAFVALDAPTYLLYHTPHMLFFPFSAVQQQFVITAQP